MDGWERDKISLNLRREAAEHVEECYRDLGWQVDGVREDKSDEGMLTVDFFRPHKIDNKDELQLLQVRLDIALNDIGKNVARRSLRAMWTGLVLGIATLAFLLQGVMMLVLFSGAAAIAFGVIACACGVACGALCTVFTVKLYKIDCAKSERYIEVKTGEIGEICARAKFLRGEVGE